MSHILESALPPGALPVAPEGLSILEWAELQVWRKLGGRLQGIVETQLAAEGDHASSDLISLQHALVELRRAPFGGIPLTAIDQTFP